MQPHPILVVDDDEDARDYIEQVLKKASLSCDCVPGAAEAIKAMERNLYAVVLADLHMPGMSGSKMISALKQISPLVQVIMLTADASTERVIECVERGAVDFFSKNGDEAPLLDAIRDALERRNRWRACLGHIAWSEVGG